LFVRHACPPALRGRIVCGRSPSPNCGCGAPDTVPGHGTSSHFRQVVRIVSFIDGHVFLPARPEIAIVRFKLQPPGAARTGKAADLGNVPIVVPSVECLLLLLFKPIEIDTDDGPESTFVPALRLNSSVREKVAVVRPLP